MSTGVDQIDQRELILANRLFEPLKNIDICDCKQIEKVLLERAGKPRADWTNLPSEVREAILEANCGKQIRLNALLLAFLIRGFCEAAPTAAKVLSLDFWTFRPILQMSEEQRLKFWAIMLSLTNNVLPEVRKRGGEIWKYCKTLARMANENTELKEKLEKQEPKEQPWDDNTEGYVSLTDACNLYGGFCKLSTLGKHIRSNKNQIRYMTKGRRTKVNLADLRKHIDSHPNEPAFAEAFQYWLKGYKKNTGQSYYWRCSNPSCRYEYPDTSSASTECPKCSAESNMILPPKPKLPKSRKTT